MTLSSPDRITELAETLAAWTAKLSQLRAQLGAHPDSRALRVLVDEATAAQHQAHQDLIAAVRPRVESELRDEIAAEEPEWLSLPKAAAKLDIAETTLRRWSHQAEPELQTMFSQPSRGKILVNAKGLAKRLGGVGVAA